ncbi:unnamed protein product [Closterium sp. NIES-64]|nr:unnamed protein product [Closterium sp. NIES-64]
MALFFSAAGWFRRRFVGPRTAEAGVRRGSPSASAEACADRAARARRKMIGMRKLTRAEREATEAEERKQREEIAQMVDAQRKAREQAEGANALAATPPTFAAASSAALPSSSPLPASALSSSPVPSSSAASLTTTLTTTTTPHSYLANPFALPFSSPFSLGFSPTLVPATPVDPAPLTNSPLNLSTPAAPLPSTAVGTVERSGFTGSKNNFNAARHAFPGSWSAGGVASESSQQSPRFPGSWSAGGQDLTGFGDALKSNAFRAAIGGGRGGVGGGASGGGMRAAWMAEMWDEDVPPAFVDCITQEIMRDPVITADGHSYERAAIEKWLMHHDTSPMTGKGLGVSGLGQGSAQQQHPPHALQLHLPPRAALQQLLLATAREDATKGVESSSTPHTRCSCIYWYHLGLHALHLLLQHT